MEFPKTLLCAIISLFIMLIVSCDKDVSITSADPDAPAGKIIINSEPQGAQIFINGYNTGKTTPDSIINIEPGMYRTKLRLSPYLDIEDSVLVGEYNPVNILINFFEDSRNFGKIVCLSDPEGASIFINDSATGLTTPADLEPLWPDAYKITCSFPEHRDNHKYVWVRGGQTKVTEIILQDTSICVDYNYYVSDFPAVHTSCVELGPDGVLWAGNYPGGIVKIDNGNWTYINTSNSVLKDNSITALNIDIYNNKWVGTSTGVVKIDANDNLTEYGNQSLRELDYIMAIACDNLGNTWIASTNFSTRRYLWKITGDDWEKWLFPIYRVIVSMEVDNENRLWVGLDRGIMIFENGEWSLPPGNYSESDQRLTTFSIETIKYDPRGYMWIGTATPLGAPGKLFFFDGLDYNILETPVDYISHIHIADNNNIWISCNGKFLRPQVDDFTPLLMKIDSDFNVTGYSFDSIKIPSSSLKHSTTDNEGNVWIGSTNMGLIKFKGGNL